MIEPQSQNNFGFTAFPAKEVAVEQKSISHKELSPREIWDDCCEIIKGQISGPSFRTWINPIEPLRIENNKLIVSIPNQFFIEWLE